ncbi:WXG100 family type VII secretion target [Kibdelosporangium phytohabitans]|uniref:Uncharacterized protein n=1 Tax=Kibdelosporangium phytohabitans TaxID=860235 RepID=A0A0N9HZV6_9PSEU|nr:hypothetical protein [Kibdelosporangium phytohabitans]ALG12885.1 hypothetical protein AOZ06_43920 [Kibdelosporangium phytohabitans]MBE1464589.1 hypothetical protein [Kibdelosporangium phytohabitans]
MTSADIQPDVLRAAVPKFRAAGDELVTAMNTLFAGGQGEGAPWGGDKIGQAFAKGYLPAVEEARKGFTSVSASTRETGEALEIAARKWEEQENRTKRKYGG